jgi:hypothetical protein
MLVSLIVEFCLGGSLFAVLEVGAVWPVSFSFFAASASFN